MHNHNTENKISFIWLLYKIMPQTELNSHPLGTSNNYTIVEFKHDIKKYTYNFFGVKSTHLK